MYDKFTGHHDIEMQKLEFQSVRYEVWMNATLVDSGSTTSLLLFLPTTINEKTVMRVMMPDSRLSSHLIQSFDFDYFFTQGNRLMMLTLPANQSNKDCIGLTSMRSTIKPSRQHKIFDSNEPYCCSLFLIEGKINKIAFSLNSPEKLIEFYSTEANRIEDLVKSVSLLERLFKKKK